MYNALPLSKAICPTHPLNHRRGEDWEEYESLDGNKVLTLVEVGDSTLQHSAQTFFSGEFDPCKRQPSLSWSARVCLYTGESETQRFAHDLLS